MNRLLKKSSLTIVRYGTYYIDDEGNPVLSTPQNIPILCNIQPFREGQETVLLEDGTQIKTGEIVRTTTLLRTMDDDTQLPADEAVIDGKPHICFKKENWDRYLSQKHYKYIFVRKDKL